MHLPALLDIPPKETIEGAAARITPKPDAVIFLLGSFDQAIASDVRSFCARAIAPVALLTKALIVDDGSAQGLAGLMGQVARQMDEAPELLGILDSGESAFAAEHARLLRLPAEWPDPAKSRIRILAEWTQSVQGTVKPVVVVLFGGDEADKMTVLRCARRSWPILIVQGAGGLGDALLAARAAGANGKPAPDPEVAEILAATTLCPLPIAGEADDLKRLLQGLLRQPTEVLRDAWSRFDDLDLAAKEKQKQFHATQLAMLWLAVLATLLAVLISKPTLPGARGLLPQFTPTVWARFRQGLHLLLIVVPITLSILAGFNSRFREGNKWVLLRAAAESIKREIFRYRARAGIYSAPQCLQLSPQSKLAANLKEITSNLMQSEVNRSSLAHRDVDDPARLTLLTPEEFLEVRVEDQQAYLVAKTRKLYRRLRVLQVAILLAGGLGTFLAAIHLDVWVALTTALATAVTAKLETDQVETSLVQYNVSLTNLNNIRSWWLALTSWEKTRQKNIDLLVEETEKTLERETAGWVQQMQSALDKLSEKQEHPAQSSAAEPTR